MSVAAALEEEINSLRVRPLAPGMVAAALALASAIDANDGATARANAVAQLRMVMTDLRELAPVDSAGDVIDELTTKRRERQRDAS